MRLLYVPINQEAMDRLRALALEERRRPQDQAAVLLESVLGVGQSTNEISKADGCDEPKK